MIKNFLSFILLVHVGILYSGKFFLTECCRYNESLLYYEAFFVVIAVLLVVFKNLDDISLWTAGMVCPRWQQLLQAETSESQWREYIKLRWPLFNPQYKVKNWKTIYTKL